MAMMVFSVGRLGAFRYIILASKQTNKTHKKTPQQTKQQPQLDALDLIFVVFAGK